MKRKRARTGEYRDENDGDDNDSSENAAARASVESIKNEHDS